MTAVPSKPSTSGSAPGSSVTPGPARGAAAAVVTDAPDATVAAADTLRADADAREAAAHARAPQSAHNRFSGSSVKRASACCSRVSVLFDILLIAKDGGACKKMHRSGATYS